jgi:Lrp/AsnC family transcriptional regulator, leucine-responsive regulatory protein
MKRLGYENGELDAADQAILTILVDNARTTTTEIARLVGLSPPTVTERMRRLEESGVIVSYSATISPSAIGLPVSVWIRIRPVPGELARVAQIIRDIPEIIECDRVTGEDCFVARAHLASVGEMERVIDKIIPFAMTNTSIIQSSPVARRLPPLPRI